jgi:hypothetical protein
LCCVGFGVCIFGGLFRSSGRGVDLGQVPARLEQADEFDPNDFQRTVKWAVASGERLNEDVGNAIRHRDTLNNFNEKAPGYTGQKVRWSVKVVSVSDTYVFLWSEYGTTWSQLLLKKEGQQLDTSQLFLPGETWVLGVGNEISREKAKRLNPSDEVVITAEVVKVELKRKYTNQCYVEVILRNVHSE